MIQVRGLTKVFPGGTKAVDGLDLEVSDGEILGLLGPNGAGKTTTIRALSTLCGFDEGEVKVAGFDVDAEPHRVRESIGVVAQNTGIDYFLTGRENLELQGQMYRMNKADIRARVTELARYFELEDSLDRTVTTYSGGMRRKLDIATALIHRPKLVFLDEPTLGLDIKSRKILWNYITKLNKEMGLTILLTTHYLEEADQLADRVAIINAGKIRVVGTPDELKRGIAGDAMTLSVEKQDWTTQQFTQTLKQSSLIKDSLWQGNKLHLYVDNGAESVPKITALASEKQVRILTLSLSRPSLDDVFLKYTGTSLEGDTEESGDEWWKQWAGKGGGGKWQKQWEQSQAENQDDAAAGEDAQQWTEEETAQWQNKQWSPEEMESWQKQKAVENATANPQTSAASSQTWSAEETAQWQSQQWSPEEMDEWRRQQHAASVAQQAPASGAAAWSEEETSQWLKKQWTPEEMDQWQRQREAAQSGGDVSAKQWSQDEAEQWQNRQWTPEEMDEWRRQQHAASLAKQTAGQWTEEETAQWLKKQWTPEQMDQWRRQREAAQSAASTADGGEQQWTAEETAQWESKQWSPAEMDQWQKQREAASAASKPQGGQSAAQWSAEETAQWQNKQWSEEEMVEWQKQQAETAKKGK